MPDNSDPRKALHWYWDRFATFEKTLEASLTAKYPTQVKLIGNSVEWVYGWFVSPGFAILVSFLLVPLVLSEAISPTTWICVATAWLIAVFGLARRTAIKHLPIAKRIGAVAGLSVAMAMLGYQYIGFTLRSYYKRHPPEPIVATMTQPTQTQRAETPTANSDLLERRMKEILDAEVKKVIEEERRQNAKTQTPQTTSTQTSSPTQAPSTALPNLYASLSLPDLRGKVDYLIYQVGGAANTFHKVIDGISKPPSDYYTSESAKMTWNMHGADRVIPRQQLLQAMNFACSGIRANAVSLISEMATREKLQPPKPEPTCLATGYASDSTDYTDTGDAAIYRGIQAFYDLKTYLQNLRNAL